MLPLGNRYRRRGEIRGEGPAVRILTPEINVTPLVDVVLVLLIIFMVISPQLEMGERVDLPVAANVGKKAELNVLTVTMTKAGKLMLEKEEVSPDGLLLQLQHFLETDPSRKLVFKVDRGVKYGKVRELFQQAQVIGFRGAALLVEEAKEGKGT